MIGIYCMFLSFFAMADTSVKPNTVAEVLFFKTPTKVNPTHRYLITSDKLELKVPNDATKTKKISLEHALSIQQELTRILWQSKIKNKASSKCPKYGELKTPFDRGTICIGDRSSVVKTQALLNRLDQTIR